MNTSKTIVFFGTEDFSAVSLQRLLDDGFSIAAVVTKPDSRRGRSKELVAPPVKQIALAHDITVLQPTKLMEAYDDLHAYEGSLGVLVSYGKIIPQAVIDLFSPGIINVHPSLLPKYRGPSPIETAILNGDPVTGVSIMQLSAAMDAGPVYSQMIVPLFGTETGPALTEKLAVIGAEHLCVVLPAIIDGVLAPTPQDDARANYCHLLNKAQSELDPATVSAVEAERHVRAFLDYPKTKVTLLGHSLVILRAHIAQDLAEDETTPLTLHCNDGLYLCIDELIGPSGRRMDAQSFLRGYAPSA